MISLYALRHFKTDNNVKNVISGSNPSIPIIESSPIACEIEFDKIYCSSALRCIQTLDEYLGVKSVSNIIYTDRILERDLGDLEGTPRKEAAKLYPTLFCGPHFNVFQTPPNGESFLLFHNRVLSFWQNLQERDNGDILVCSHNQFLKMLYFINYNKHVTTEEWNALSFRNGIIARI